MDSIWSLALRMYKWTRTSIPRLFDRIGRRDRSRTMEMGRSAMDLAAVVAVATLLLCFGVVGVRSDASNHRYKTGDHVPLYVNKVGPFHNPRWGPRPSLTSDLSSFFRDPRRILDHSEDQTNFRVYNHGLVFSWSHLQNIADFSSLFLISGRERVGEPSRRFYMFQR